MTISSPRARSSCVPPPASTNYFTHAQLLEQAVCHLPAAKQVRCVRALCAGLIPNFGIGFPKLSAALPVDPNSFLPPSLREESGYQRAQISQGTPSQRNPNPKCRSRDQSACTVCSSGEGEGRNTALALRPGSSHQSSPQSPPTGGAFSAHPLLHAVGHPSFFAPLLLGVFVPPC